jgi:hypothetical protein
MNLETTNTDFVFKCKICGRVLNLKSGSKTRSIRDSWQCPNGCKIEDNKTYYFKDYIKENNFKRFIRYLKIIFIIVLVVFALYVFIAQFFYGDIIVLPYIH